MGPQPVCACGAGGPIEMSRHAERGKTILPVARRSRAVFFFSPCSGEASLRYRMRWWSAIVALVVASSVSTGAQASPWHVDAGGTALVEAWDFNGSGEALA